MPRIQTVVIHDGPQGAPGATGATGSPGPALTPKGSVATVGALPASGNTVGDLYMVSGTSHAYGWNGSAWVDLGLFTANAWGTLTGTLSAQTDLNTALAGKASTASVTQITPGDGQVIIGATTPIKANGPLNVKAKGAVGDGVTSDTGAFGAAMTAAGSSGTRIDVPRATYALGSQLVLKSGTLHLRGDGSPSTVIKPTTLLSANILSFGQSTDHLILEDLTFDSASFNTTFFSTAHDLHRLTVRRCRFTNTANTDFLGSGVERVLIEDCDFDGAGSWLGTAINFATGCYDITIRRNRFRWLQNGILLSGGGAPDYTRLMEKIVIEDNHFDGYWWLGAPQMTGSGGTVSYTSTAVTDTTQTFTGLPTNLTVNIRVMPVRQASSTATTFSSLQVTETGATFVTNGVKRGEIVRTDDGLKWGVVSSVVSETILNVEEWFDATTYAPTGTPANGTAITVYGVLIGNISAVTATTATTGQWVDLDGLAATPAAGTRYEVLRTRPNYHLNITAPARDIRVVNNTFRRGWSDQCSIYSGGAQILGNLIEDGEDMGITLNGGVTAQLHGASIIANNVIKHQGTSGIWCTAPDTIITGNQIITAPWTNTGDGYLGGITAAGGNRTKVVANVVDGESKPLARYGITVTYPGDSIEVLDNTVRNVSTADIRLWGSSGSHTTNTHIRGKHTIRHDGNGVTEAGQFYELRGAGSPAGTIVAGPGSTWLDTTNGALYVKQGTTTDASGWTLK